MLFHSCYIILTSTTLAYIFISSREHAERAKWRWEGEARKKEMAKKERKKKKRKNVGRLSNNGTFCKKISSSSAVVAPIHFFFFFSSRFQTISVCCFAYFKSNHCHWLKIMWQVKKCAIVNLTLILLKRICVRRWWFFRSFIHPGLLVVWCLNDTLH